MKKLISIFAVILTCNAFAQGTLYIYNYSSYELVGRLFAAHPTNCLPEVHTSYNVPAGGMIQMNSYNAAGSITPAVDVWYVRTTPTSTGIPQYPPSSGLLTTLSPITQWANYWFQIRIPGSSSVLNEPTFKMGEPFATTCGAGDSVDHQAGTLAEATWFYIPATNETYLIVDDI